jgi:hypothetical protein
MFSSHIHFVNEFRLMSVSEMSLSWKFSEYPIHWRDSNVEIHTTAVPGLLSVILIFTILLYKISVTKVFVVGHGLFVIYFSICYNVQYLSCGILSRPQAGLPSNRGSISGREKTSYLLPSVQTHSFSRSISTGMSFFRNKAAGMLKLTNSIW